MAEPLIFAVIGDTHFLDRRSYSQRKADMGPGEWADCRRYLWMMKKVMPRLLQEIASEQPRFLIQLGDFVQGNYQNYEQAAAEMKLGLDLLATAGCPLYIARGNHEGRLSDADRRAYRDVVFPVLSRQLGKDLAADYFSFHQDGCHFIILDYLDFESGSSQPDWLEQRLKEVEPGERVFVFGHGPLFPVARHFFTNREFAFSVSSLLGQYPIDAYFCGHTHNQCLSLHHLSHPLLQVKTCPIGFPDDPLVPLEEVRAFALPPQMGEFDYYWGYLEDSAPAWVLIEAEKDRVRLSWRLLDQGVQGILEWQEPGQIRVVKRPETPTRTKINAGHLPQIRWARLHLTGASGITVSLNGQVIISSAPKRKFIEIPQDRLSLIRMENQVVVDSPRDKPVCLGGVYLQVGLTDGRTARTNVCPYLYATSDKWDVWGLKILRHVKPGQHIPPIELKF